MSIGGHQITTSMLATSTPLQTTEFAERRSVSTSRSGLTRALVSRGTAAAKRSDSAPPASAAASSTGLATAIRRCSVHGPGSAKSMNSRSINETISDGSENAPNPVAATEVVTLLLVTDRRRSTRHSCDKPVVVRPLNAMGQSVSNRSIPARMVDVAATGIAILCSETISVGQCLSVEFQGVVEPETDVDGNSQSQTRNVLTGAVLRSELIDAGKPDRRIVFVPDRPLTTAQIASLGTDLFAGTIV